MPFAIALFAGALFGAGLTVAQMVDPNRVLNFLDVAAIPSGRWDPTLLFVFIGALPTMFLAYRMRDRMQKPVCAEQFESPARNAIDTPLIAGSAIFGIGWGLAGICPGPALAALPLAAGGLTNLALFIAAMIAGIAAQASTKRA